MELPEVGELSKAKMLVIGLSLLSVILSGCPEKEDRGFEDARRPTQIAEGFTLTETVAGERAWTLKAEKALSYEDEDLIRIYGVTLDFYKEGGVRYSTLTSEEGIVHTGTNDMEAFGNVVVVSEQGRLETSTLNWVAKEGKIVTDDEVKIAKGETVITGRGLESDPSLERVKITEQFRAYGKEIRQQDEEEAERSTGP